ncbi:MAG: hypothetical protein IMF07_08480 [Proteobacteria bacterium]|nr:hypothetical protein [Pseudomonadota bacterium]
MLVRLGEMLVKSKVITSDQLEEALKAQVMFGGKLGTNLIELDFVCEKTLAKALSAKLSVPFVSSDTLLKIPKRTIKALPRDLVEKYKVVPLTVDKTRITVATSDPSDLFSLDELRFVSGKAIKTVIAPELSLALAMEKYYDIPRDVRYIRIEASNSEKNKKKEEGNSSQAVKKSSKPDMPGFIDFNPDAKPDKQVDDEQFAANRGLEEAIDEYAIGELYRKLAASENREEMSECIIDYLSQRFQKIILFIMKEHSAIGWKGLSRSKRVANISQLELSLKEPSVLSIVSEGKDPYYFGSLTYTPGNLKIAKALGSKELSSEVLVTPISIKGRVICAIYLEGGKTPLKFEISHIDTLAQKISIAFEILMLKNKLIMT